MKDLPQINHKQLIEELSLKTIEILGAVTNFKQPTAHLWYEESFNFGDSAIWKGQVDLLNNFETNVQYECSDKTYSAKNLQIKMPDNGQILLRGGGNFGDLYAYHKLRLEIINHFPDKRIIQLPQSAKFFENGSLNITKKIINNHTDTILLARDNVTFDLFSEYFKSTNTKIKLCPDMAFVSGCYKRPINPVVDILGLLRIDAESKHLQQRGKLYNRDIEKILAISKVNTQKYTVSNNMEPIVQLKHYSVSDQSRHIELTDWYLTSMPHNGWDVYNKLSYYEKSCLGVDMALNILSRGKVVVTDRLHAYILCLQLGIPHIIIDNSYGKLTAFYETWGTQSKITYLANSVNEAFDIAKQLADSTSTEEYQANNKAENKSISVQLQSKHGKKAILKNTTDSPYQQGNTHTGYNRYPEIFQICKNYFINKQNLEILSFGCSFGEECFSLRDLYFPSAHIVGIGINEQAINHCKQSPKNNTGNLNFYLSKNFFAARKKKFDVIFMMSFLCVWPETAVWGNCEALYSFKKYKAQLKQIIPYIKRGGLLVIYNSNFRFSDTDNLYSQFTPIYNNEIKNKGFVTVFDKNNNRIDQLIKTEYIFKKN